MSQISLSTKIFNSLRVAFKLQPLEKMIAGLTQNKHPTYFISKLLPNCYQYAANTLRYANRDGINYKLDLSDYIDWFIYFGLKDDGKKNLISLVKEGDCIIDVGANVGELSMNFALGTGVKGKIYSFEPDPENFRRFITNLSLNTFENIIVENKGLGDKKGTFNIINYDLANKGKKRITSEVSLSPTSQIEIVTLDEYFAALPAGKIDLIKIDTEGFEVNVLKGGAELLKKFKPKLFIEVDDSLLKKQGSNAGELISFIINCNYKVINAASNNSINEKNNFENCHFDILCLPD